MRFPRDDGVDRPELDAPQGVKVTGTNNQYKQPRKQSRKTKNTNTHVVHYAISDTPHTRTNVRVHHKTRIEQALNNRVGGDSGWETPGPIPNPEAKPTHADGTAPGRMWESRTPPTTNKIRRPPTITVGGLLLYCLVKFHSGAADPRVFRTEDQD